MNANQPPSLQDEAERAAATAEAVVSSLGAHVAGFAERFLDLLERYIDNTCNK
jgi:hypothetical protein